jgi:hypothetical protein
MRLHQVKTRLAAVTALAAATAVVSVPVASADTPVGPGGCNMLTPALTQSPVGLTPMMAGSGNPNGTGIGAANMKAMLRTFYPQAEFCGL